MRLEAKDRQVRGFAIASGRPISRRVRRHSSPLSSDGAGHQVLEAGDGAVGELMASVLDPSLIGRVARHRAARCLLYGPGRPHVVGVSVGQDEPRDLLGAAARTPQVYEIKIIEFTYVASAPF